MSDPEDQDPPGHMTPDAFRRLGYQAVDWVARYMEEVADKPVLSAVRPGDCVVAPFFPSFLCVRERERERERVYFSRVFFCVKRNTHHRTNAP